MYYVSPLTRWLPVSHLKMPISVSWMDVLRRRIMLVNSTPRSRRTLAWCLGTIYMKQVKNRRHSVYRGLGNTLLRQQGGFASERLSILAQARNKVSRRSLTPLQHILLRNTDGKYFLSSLKRATRKHTNSLRVS